MSLELEKYYLDRLRHADMLTGQAAYLSVGLLHEHKNIDKQIEEVKKRPDNSSAKMNNGVLEIYQEIPWVNTTYRSSLEFSLMLMMFSTIEGILSAVSDCALKLDEEVGKLSDAEYTFLTQKKEQYSKGKVVELSNFQRIEDRLEFYPKIFAELNNKNFKLKKETDWQKFLKAKVARDRITHPEKTFYGYVNLDDLFAAAESLYWYHGIIWNLFDDCTVTDFHMNYRHHEQMTYQILSIVDHICHKGKKGHITSQIKRHNALRKEKV